jgi:hypothetical protein
MLRDLNNAMSRATTFAIGPLLLFAITIPRAVTRDGVCNPVTLLSESFDGVTPPALPPGWSSTTWVTSNSGAPVPPADSLPNAAFIDDPANVSDKQLVSPSIFLFEGGEPVQITFRNNFNFQDGFDGGVLEISTDGGNTFQDIGAVGGNFANGGYNGTISTCCGNPLAGRRAWTGSSGGFITTIVNLPISWGPNMVLRWRMGSDNGISAEGWRLDTILITQCHKPIPSPPPTPRPTVTTRARPTPAPRPSAASNRSTKPTAPWRNKFSVLATTLCRGLSPSR